MNRLDAARGEVWLASLDPIIGHEQGGTRPCAVLSVTAFNRGPAGLVIVVPLTRTERGAPLHVRIEAGTANLHATSYAMAENIRSISSQRLVRRLGALDPKIFSRITHALQDVLGF